MKIDSIGQTYYSCDELVNILYTNPDVDLSKFHVQDPASYNASVELTYSAFEILTAYQEFIGSIEELDQRNQSTWHMPKEYFDLDIAQWALDQCKTDAELQRTAEELLLFQERELFNEFWKEYPRKLDKGAAFKAFRSALKVATFEEILAGAIAYRNDPNREAEYTKYPATWLNADAWENEIAPSPDSEAAERNRARRDRELEASRTYLAELKEQEAQASAPATCPHGKTLALCLPCSREINA